MSEFSVLFHYMIRDEVTIKEIDSPGIVEEVSLTSQGNKYLVAYWADGIRQTAWVFKEELMPVASPRNHD